MFLKQAIRRVMKTEAVANALRKAINPLEQMAQIQLSLRHNVLSACAKFHKTVLLASTSEVYGKSGSCPFREEDDAVYGPTTKSRWSYACSKAIDEFLALAYAEEKGLPVIIVRLFNTTGPRQTGRYGMVLPRFIKQALEGAPITVYGNGRQSRCFANVGDVVDALLRLWTNPRSLGQVFNPNNKGVKRLCKERRKECVHEGYHNWGCWVYREQCGESVFEQRE
jgi:UDP-glucose 4-epimerase